ncbi:MAG: hypothetical protein O3B65_02185 [Chloroflexi bacterium]|nr:hypothetical protein [Chloroflexota bacterium]
MQYRKLGSSDLSVSVVGLGTNNFGGRITDHAESARVVHEAIDQGVNLIHRLRRGRERGARGPRDQGQA